MTGKGMLTADELDDIRAGYDSAGAIYGDIHKLLDHIAAQDKRIEDAGSALERAAGYAARATDVTDWYREKWSGGDGDE